jgi:hypothetical protein
MRVTRRDRVDRGTPLLDSGRLPPNQRHRTHQGAATRRHRGNRAADDDGAPRGTAPVQSCRLDRGALRTNHSWIGGRKILGALPEPKESVAEAGRNILRHGDGSARTSARGLSRRHPRVRNGDRVCAQPNGSRWPRMALEVRRLTVNSPALSMRPHLISRMQ